MTLVRDRPEQRIADLIDIAQQYRSEGRTGPAEALLRDALVLIEESCPADAGRLVLALNTLGLLYKDVGKYELARSCYLRALTVLRADGGTDSASVATLYHNLGGVEHARRDFAAGEPLARTGLEIRRRSTRRDDRDLAADMVALAAILDGQNKFDEAESLYLEALGILEKDSEANAHEIAVAFNDLGANYARRGRLDEAEALLTRALDVKTGRSGEHRPDVALTLNNLAFVREQRGAAAQAADLYAKALQIFEQSVGPDHPITSDCRRNYERARAVHSRM